MHISTQLDILSSTHVPKRKRRRTRRRTQPSQAICRTNDACYHKYTSYCLARPACGPYVCAHELNKLPLAPCGPCCARELSKLPSGRAFPTTCCLYTTPWRCLTSKVRCPVMHKTKQAHDGNPVQSRKCTSLSCAHSLWLLISELVRVPLDESVEPRLPNQLNCNV